MSKRTRIFRTKKVKILNAFCEHKSGVQTAHLLSFGRNIHKFASSLQHCEAMQPARQCCIVGYIPFLFAQSGKFADFQGSSKSLLRYIWTLAYAEFDIVAVRLRDGSLWYAGASTPLEIAGTRFLHQMASMDGGDALVSPGPLQEPVDLMVWEIFRNAHSCIARNIFQKPLFRPLFENSAEIKWW